MLFLPLNIFVGIDLMPVHVRVYKIIDYNNENASKGQRNINTHYRRRLINKFHTVY